MTPEGCRSTTLVWMSAHTDRTTSDPSTIQYATCFM